MFNNSCIFNSIFQSNRKLVFDNFIESFSIKNSILKPSVTYNY